MASDAGKPPKKRKKRSNLSEMVQHRIDAAAELLASFEAFKESIVEALEERHAPLLEEGETLPDYGLSLDLSAREVRIAIDELDEIDHEHALHKATLDGLRRQRDRLVTEEAYPRLVSVRGSIDSAFGRKAGQRFHGLKGQTPRKMPRLGRALDNVAHWLESPDVKLPKTRASGFGADREMWREQLRIPRKLLADNARELRGANKWDEKLRIDKSRSMEEFDRVYAHSFGLLKATMIKARVEEGMLRHLYSLDQRRSMAKRARDKRKRRAEERAAAAEAGSDAAVRPDEPAVPPDEPGADATVPPDEPGEKSGRKSTRMSFSSWLGKGSA